MSDHYTFQFDQRLGVSLPVLEQDWDQYSLAEQEEILQQWEAYRANIPKRIKELEYHIETKQHQLSNEDHFTRSCQLNREIAELASIINDLNIWYRIQQETNSSIHRRKENN